MPPTKPVEKMPAVTNAVGNVLKVILDKFRGRIDALGMINRNLAGDVLIQVPSIGSQPTELFNVDRMAMRIDGSNGLVGSIELPIRTVTATAMLQPNDFTVLGDATAAAFTVFVPASNLIAGRIYVVKKIDASANAVTVDANGGELIDGATTYALGAQWDSVMFQSNGTALYRLAS